MNPQTHLCLVSAQATPNLTPILDPAVAPRRVILLVSPDMADRAHWLEAVLRPRGIAVQSWPIADAWDVEHVQTRVLELLEVEREAVAASAIALNATGGTKPMSIAAYEAFRAYDLPIFYVDPERDRLVWIGRSFARAPGERRFPTRSTLPAWTRTACTSSSARPALGARTVPAPMPSTAWTRSATYSAGSRPGPCW